MDVNAKIASVEAELAELKSQFSSVTSDKEERIALRQQISAKENQLTEYLKLLPKEGNNFSFSFPLIYSSIFCFHAVAPLL